MRWSRGFVASLFLVLIAACSSPGGTPAGDDGGSDDTDASQQTQTQAATPDDDGGGGSDDGDDDGGGGAASGDLDGLMADLTPPNSNEISRTSGDGFLYVIFESSDSPDSLEGFYDGALGDAGMESLSKTESEGSFAWVFGDSSDSGFGGAIGVGPGADGSGSTVSVQIGTNS